MNFVDVVQFHLFVFFVLKDVEDMQVVKVTTVAVTSASVGREIVATEVSVGVLGT